MTDATRRPNQTDEGSTLYGTVPTPGTEDSPIVPVVIGNSIHCLKVAERLFRRGINVQPMLYPAVPEEASRLRFFVTASHRPEQLEATVGEVRDALAAARAERLN